MFQGYAVTAWGVERRGHVIANLRDQGTIQVGQWSTCGEWE